MNRLSPEENALHGKLESVPSNKILSLLPEGEYARLAPHLEPVELKVGQILHRPGLKRGDVFFPTSCIVALHQFDREDHSASVGMVGRSGMVGLPLVLQSPQGSHQAEVVVAGHAWRIAVQTLQREFFRGGALMNLLLQLTNFELTNLSQRVVCRMHHNHEQQVCDRLAHLQDLGESAHIRITQTRLASLLGMRRQGVSEVLGRLAALDMLGLARGRISVLDRPQIDHLSCGCYDLVKEQCKQLFLQQTPVSEAPTADTVGNLRDSYLTKRVETLETALTHSAIVCWDIDLYEGNIELAANDLLCTLLGYAPGTVRPTPKDWCALVHQDDQAVREAARAAHLRGESNVYDSEYRIRHREGHWVWIHTRGKVVERDRNDQPVRMVGTSQDITVRKNFELALERLTRTDYLTQASNRKHFFDLGEREFSRAQRHGSALSLLSMDLDHFKYINDRHGHAGGDQVLKNFAATMGAHLRLTDLFARVGGEEFCLLLPHTDSAGAMAMAQRVLESVRSQTVTTDTGPIRYTVSLGISTINGTTPHLSALLQASDQALYRAKELGRDRAEVAVDPR